MIEIIVTFCLFSNPQGEESCKDNKYVAFGALTPYNCFFMSNDYAVKFAESNPSYRIKNYKCKSLDNVAITNGK